MNESTHPNIVYVFADQMRSTALGCSGVEKVHTPNFDRFATEGTRFTNAISNTPVCSPARASLISGLHTITHRLVANDIQLRTDITSIAHCLNAAGYKCGYVGKWHMDGQDRGIFIPPGPRRQGFDDLWFTNNCNHQYLQAYAYRDANPEPIWLDGQYEPDAQTDVAVEYIHAKAAQGGPFDAAQGKPFSLFVSYGAPHCPYDQVPGDSLDRYPPEKIELMPTAASARVVGHTDGDGPSAEEDRIKRTKIAGYYAHITALDACFGRVLDALTEAGIDDNTIVVFSSDHGDMLFNHNRGWKCKPWRESAGIPLLMRWPGHIPTGRETDGPISIVDHMPTLLSLAGVSVPEEVQGQDLSAYVLGDESAAPKSAFINMLVTLPNWEHTEWRGVVTRTHTYARFRDRPWVLYDDTSDPLQTHNLVDDPAAAALQEDLDAKVQQWLDRTDDPFETSLQVADRYLPGHTDGVMPYYENETIRRGRAERNAH